MLALDTPPELAAHPLVVAARRVCATVLAPAAERVDALGVPRAHVLALAEAGLLGLAGAATPVLREVEEQLAAACGSTWLVATQHRLPQRLVAGSDNPELRERWAPALDSGAALAGVAFAHLRRDPPPVTARATEQGWQVSGPVPWFSSWGLADVLVLGAVAGSRIMWALLPARAQPGLEVSAPLPLAAMAGTHTVSLRLRGLTVRPEAVVATEELADWRAADARRNLDARPGPFGLLRAVLPRLGEPAAQLQAQAAQVRAQAYARAGDDAAAAQRLALRTWTLTTAVDSAAALVALAGGRGMTLDASPQRLAREALFHLVQGQTPQLRTALAQRFLEVSDAP